MNKIVLWGFLVGLVVACVFLLTANAVAKTESHECKQWEKQAKEYEHFYYTAWQKQQCGIN